jgi:hypothetical protein
MGDSRITVSQTELEKTFRIWVNTAPRRMWQDYFRCSETTYKWGGGVDPFDRFDPRHLFARFLAEKFRQAGWTVTYPVPLHPTSGAPLAPHCGLADPGRDDPDDAG